MSENDSVDWSLLPHNPAAFFDLCGDYHRKALKRKYGSLIRIYKPEKFPDEFQRIRAAYEMLDAGLRYGHQQVQLPAASSYQWNPGTESGADVSAATSSAPASKAVDSIADRLKKESPAVIYKELNAKRDKSPFDYFALALVADVVTKDKSLFFKWLLTGLKAHPTDPGLFSMLYEYFHEDIDADLAGPALLATSQVISNDRFYFLTEKLWRSFLRKSQFKQFRATLQKCEKNLKDYQINGRLAFYVQLLPAAIWKADQQWIDDAFAILEEHALEIPPNLEMDFEFLMTLREYRGEFKSVVGSNAVRKKIHATIVNCLSLPESEADAAMIRCQTSLGHDASSLLKAFPPTEDEATWRMVNVWEVISEDVCQRHELADEVNHRKLAERIFRLLCDLDLSEPFTTARWAEQLGMLYGPYVAAVVMPFIMMSQWLGNSIVLVIAITLAASLPAAVYFLLKPEELYRRRVRGWARGRYLRSWRDRFVQLIDATQASHYDLQQATMIVVGNNLQQLGLSSFAFELVPIDAGLAMYTWTARFAR